MKRRKRKYFSEPQSYLCGREAREKNTAKIVPPAYKGIDYWWWLAGYNDRDMELSR